MTSCSEPIPSTIPDPISLLDLPKAISATKFVPGHADSHAIRNVLALYPFAVDGKKFSALKRVFEPEAVANYAEPLNVLKGVDEIWDALEKSLEKVTTQHSLGVPYINVKASGKEAESVAYVTINHFGKGELEGQLAVVYGQYQDTWRKQKDGSEWRIVYRNFVYMGPVIGNKAVLA